MRASAPAPAGDLAGAARGAAPRPAEPRAAGASGASGAPAPSRDPGPSADDGVPGAALDARLLDARPAGPRGAALPALYVRRWRRLEGERGVLAIVPGFSDHGGRYPHLVRAAIERGYGAAALDTRGHGRSEGPRGHVERFRDFHLDVDRFLGWVRADSPRAPLALWGHSMGGLILLGYLSAGLARGQGVGAAVVSAPALRVTVPVPLWKEALARALARTARPIPFESEIDPASLSRDLEVGRRYMLDPLVHRVCSPRLYREMQDEARRLLAAPIDYGVPTLFIHGTGDRAIDLAGTRAYFERSPLAVKDLRTYEDARHEVHNDPAREQAFADAFAFLDRALGAAR